MSNEAITWAWRQDLGSPVRKCILLHLCDSAQRETGYMSWYSIAKISERCNCSKSTVSANMKWLIENEFITLVRKGTKNGSTNCYQVHVGAVEVQNGPAEPIPADEQSIPVNGIPPIPRDERSIPADEPSIPGAGCINQRKPKETKIKIPLFDPEAVFDEVCEKITDAQAIRIVDLYNEILPHHRGVSRTLFLKRDRHKALAANWARSDDFWNEKFWVNFFKSVKLNKHWCGENERGWKADFEFLMRPRYFDMNCEEGGFDQ